MILLALIELQAIRWQYKSLGLSCLVFLRPHSAGDRKWGVNSAEGTHENLVHGVAEVRIPKDEQQAVFTTTSGDLWFEVLSHVFEVMPMAARGAFQYFSMLFISYPLKGCQTYGKLWKHEQKASSVLPRASHELHELQDFPQESKHIIVLSWGRPEIKFGKKPKLLLGRCL